MEEIEKILKRFVAWIRIKVKVHLSEGSVRFREGEIWWVNLGANVGHEEEGKNGNFERPVLIIKKFSEFLMWAVPLSTQIKEDKPYYFKYELDGREYSAILSQLRALSNKRLIRRINMFPKDDYNKICEKIRKML